MTPFGLWQILALGGSNALSGATYDAVIMGEVSVGGYIYIFFYLYIYIYIYISLKSPSAFVAPCLAEQCCSWCVARLGPWHLQLGLSLGGTDVCMSHLVSTHHSVGSPGRPATFAVRGWRPLRRSPLSFVVGGACVCMSRLVSARHSVVFVWSSVAKCPHGSSSL